jgi:hypothetical protein
VEQEHPTIMSERVAVVQPQRDQPVLLANEPQPQQPRTSQRRRSEPSCTGSRATGQGKSELAIKSYFCGLKSYTLQRAVSLGADSVQFELPIRVSANAFNWVRLSDAIAASLEEWSLTFYGQTLSGQRLPSGGLGRRES